MPLDVIVNGATKGAESAKVTVGNAQKRVTRIDAWNGSAWKLVQSFAPAISLSISPGSAFGDRESPGVVTSNSVTATPTGGTGPFTYAWSRVSGDTVTITSPTFASTTFSTVLSTGQSATAIYQCVVTDSLGQTASATVNISLINTGTGA